MNTSRRRILTIAELLNPLPEEIKKTNVIIHHSFNEVLRQLRAENPEDRKKYQRKPKKKVQPSKKPKKTIRIKT